MRALLALTLAAVAGCSATPAADPASDAPEGRLVVRAPPAPASYTAALTTWRSADDVNAWIGARFEYDMPRALLLSESQRERSGPIAIHTPEAFYAVPRGVCVDLSRFAVDTLRAIDPASRPSHLMIEFAPVSIQGQTLRRHWIAHFQRDGGHYFFADSKRPGHLAGPYDSPESFIRDYAAYRGRQIVAFRDLETTEKRKRTTATRQLREAVP